MIVSEDYLKNIQSIFQPELINTSFILTAANWCLEYWGKFQTCPGVHIEDIYEQHEQDGTITEEESDLIAELLDSISEEYDRSSEFNSKYLLDKSEKYFESQNLKQRAGNIKVALANNDLESAQKELVDYKTISRPTVQGINPFTDREAMREAFEYSVDPLFKLPGAAGEFLNDLFVRDSFVTLLGPEKKGKSWWLIELSMWARRNGCNVAFFGAGDMTLPQYLLRYGIRFCGRSNRAKFCDEIEVPVMDCRYNQDDSCENINRAGILNLFDKKGQLLKYEEALDHDPCTYCRKHPNPPHYWKGAYWTGIREKTDPLTWNEAVEKGKKLAKRWGRKNRFKLTAYAKGTLTMPGIESQLDIWENEENFIPDVLIIDYMDLLEDSKNQSNGMQPRHIINNIWGDGRKLSQERHCCLISASQSDATSYDAPWITEKHFSEAKAKNAHVTGMVTLNQTQEEKRRNIMRLGKLLTREDEFDSAKGVTVLQSLKQGKPLLDSYF